MRGRGMAHFCSGSRFFHPRLLFLLFLVVVPCHKVSLTMVIPFIGLRALIFSCSIFQLSIPSCPKEPHSARHPEIRWKDFRCSLQIH